MAAGGGSWKGGTFKAGYSIKRDPVYIEAKRQEAFINANRLGGVPLYRQTLGTVKSMERGGTIAQINREVPKMRRMTTSSISFSRRVLRRDGYEG